MEFTDTIRTRIIGILSPIFSVAFICVPLLVFGGVLVATAHVLIMPGTL